jgi:hypothetical protein
VVDDSTDDSGGIDGGWSLDLTIPAGTLGTDPQVTGTPDSGKTLTATSGTLGNGAVAAYQWNRCNARGLGCKPIAGATKDSYKLGRPDRGHTLTLTESAVTTGGTSAPQTSRHTVVVGPALLSLAGTKLSQSGRRGVRINVRSNLSGTLTAGATVGRAKLRGASRRLRAGRRVALTLTLTPAARKAIARAKKPRAKVKLVITDANGARSTKRLTIRLR